MYSEQLNGRAAVLDRRQQADAEEGYLANYEAGWQGVENVTPLTVTEFKAWLATGDQQQRIQGQTLKLSTHSPIYERALAAQLSDSSWDNSRSLLSNLLTNTSQGYQRGQQMVDEQEQARQFQEHLNPDQGWKHLRDLLGGREKPGPEDPLDQALFGAGAAFESGAAPPGWQNGIN